MRRLALGLLILIAILASACASPQPASFTYTRPNTSQQEFLKDRYKCIQEALVAYSVSSRRVGAPGSGPFSGASSGSKAGERISCGLLSSCMEAMGYAIHTDGSGMAPSQRVKCYD